MNAGQLYNRQKLRHQPKQTPQCPKAGVEIPKSKPEFQHFPQGKVDKNEGD